MRGRLVICAVGLKGKVFVESLLAREASPDRIVSYEQANDRSRGFDHVRAMAEASGIAFESNRKPGFAAGDLVLVVGWQHKLDPGASTFVVLHDSLLPKYRGFAPTVTALIRGDDVIGVTALLGTDSIDEGPIVGSRRTPVVYPVTIGKALELQAHLMVNLAEEVIRRWRDGMVDALPQDDAESTYSLWRDEDDFWIDWSRPAEEIARFVDAVGFPYSGARTRMQGEPIVIRHVTVVADLKFELRAFGKLWQLRDGLPIVVCGSGMLRVDAAEGMDGLPVTFNRLRVRLR